MRAAVAGLRGAVSFHAPLRDYTSFRIGGPADVVVEPADIQDVCPAGSAGANAKNFHSSSWVGRICSFVTGVSGGSSSAWRNCGRSAKNLDPCCMRKAVSGCRR